MTAEEEILTEKPRFYYMDIGNYTSSFLQEIILWQKRYIELLEKKLNALRNNK